MSITIANANKVGKSSTANANEVSKFSREHYVMVGIYDAKTQIRIGSIASIQKTRSSERAEKLAESEAYDYVVDELAKPWMCKRYGITASQFDAMVADGVIDPIESFTLKTEVHRVYSLNPKG